jgi:hypothetical protein
VSVFSCGQARRYGRWELPINNKPVSLKLRLAAASASERVFGLESLAALASAAAGKVGSASSPRQPGDCNASQGTSQAAFASYADAAVHLLEDPSWQVRNAAVKALRSLGGIVAADKVEAVRRLAESHEDAAMRLLAIAVLKSFGSQNLPQVAPFPIEKNAGAPGEQVGNVSGMTISTQSKDLVLAAVQRSGESLRYVEPQFQGDHEVVLTAVRQSGDALRHASAELRADPAMAAEAVASGGPLAVQHAAQPIRDQMFIESELSRFSQLVDQWRRTEDAVYGSRSKVTTSTDENHPSNYLVRRTSLVNLMRDLAVDLQNLDLWPQAVVVLDAFYGHRDSVDLAGMPAAKEVAAAAVLILVKADCRKFAKTRFQDAKIAIATRLGMRDELDATATALHVAERCLFQTLGGRVLITSVPQWSALIFDRLELAASEKLRETLRNHRQEAMQTAELVTVRAMATDSLPPRALGRGACVASLIHAGFLPPVDEWDAASTAEAREGSDEEPPTDVECLDLPTLAWAAGCGVNQLLADARVTLHTAGPMIAPAA